MKVVGANIFAKGQQIAHVRLDEVVTPHPYALMLPQSETERLLDEHLSASGVTLERQVELVQFVAGADQVTATLRHGNGREETLDVPWLIGCDGAHSAVRHGLKMPFEGDTLASDWVLADVHLAGDFKNPLDVNTYWHSAGVLVLFPISPGRFRIIADIGDGHGGQLRPDPTLAEIQAILDERGPGGIQAADPIWLAAFRINERKVKDYRAGRVFLVGDAAHVHSPAGGQGMNTGMQDAVNLAWKLALVQRGLAGPEPLLGSYSVERSAVGEQVLTDAGRLTMLATLRSGVWQSVRNHVASLVFGLSPVRRAMATKLSELSIGYPKSPLTVSGKHSHSSPAAGDRAPITDEADLVGAGTTPHFALFAKADAEATAFIQRWSNLLEPNVRKPFADDAIWLVRPDGYVGLVAAAGDWGAVAGYLSRIKGGST